MDVAAITEAVKTEIERQQAAVDYDALSAEELEKVIANLHGRLTLCQNAAAARAGGGAKKKEGPKMVAKKAEGSWPELPWGGVQRVARSRDRSRLRASASSPCACVCRAAVSCVHVPTSCLCVSRRAHARAVAGKQDADKIRAYIEKNMEERIMIIDGAMGTTIQQYKFSEEDFRSHPDPTHKNYKIFVDHPETQELKGNNDLLCFTQPDTIREIHRRYFECGADICETNTFSGTVIAQADYAMEHIVYEMNKIACEVPSRPDRPPDPRSAAAPIAPPARQRHARSRQPSRPAGTLL